MKYYGFAIAFTIFMAGCASAPNGDDTTSAQNPNGVYNDPSYPGSGVHIGIGAGSWGGRSGGGVGLGVGF